MNHVGTKTLKTQRLTLRKFTLDDANAMFHNWASDPEVTKFMTWPAHTDVGITRMVIESWVKEYDREDYYQWAIEFEGEPIGSISVIYTDAKTRKSEIGYCIGRNWWHRGITSEALAAVMELLFKEVGVNRIQARHDTNNPHSGGVMRKCGMTYEGTLRQEARNNQGIVDSCIYGILRNEYFNGETEAASRN